MKILLINNNPVVSRLTALSARKEKIKLDEIRNVSKLKKLDEYHIVFVDLESYNQEISNILKNSNIKKKVLFYTQEDDKKPKGFTLSILKPFLPSEVSAILRETKIEIDRIDNQSKEELSSLNELIAEKKNDLKSIQVERNIPIESEKAKEEQKSLDVKPQRSIFENTEEENLLVELNKSQKKMEEIKKSPDLIMDKPSKVVKEEKKDVIELFELDEMDDKKSIKDENNLFEIDDKKDNIDKDEVLGFDIDSKEEFNLETTPKKSNIKDNTYKKESTKILDKDEISNIKNLLDDDISLEDVMTTPSSTIKKEIEKPQNEELIQQPKKRKKKKNKRDKSGSKVIIDSLGSLPVDDLRRLLLGAEVQITIKFPKE